MTNDLISRSELLLEMAAGCVPLDEKGISGVTGDESTIYDYIKNAPAVDAAPVVHGYYGFTGPHIGETYSPYAEHGTCSNCKGRILIDPQHKKFCPNCGAKMDKEAGLHRRTRRCDNDTLLLNGPNDLRKYQSGLGGLGRGESLLSAEG